MLEINSHMVSNPLFEEEDALSYEEDVSSICESDLPEAEEIDSYVLSESIFYELDIDTSCSS